MSMTYLCTPKAHLHYLTDAPNEPQCFELKGERRPWVSSNEMSPDDNAHVSRTLDALRALMMC